MSAPAGLCESCKMPLQWTFANGLMWVRCRRCRDLFGVDLAQFLQDGLARVGRETGDGSYG